MIGGHAVMDTALDRPWTTDEFLAWEDQQEGKHEFDGVRVIAMTGGSVAHQEIVFNLRVLLVGSRMRALHEMRLLIGQRLRYPDVLVCTGPVSQDLRMLDDAVVIVDVLSDDTAATDGIDQLIDYADVPSLHSYIMMEQACRAIIVCKRAPEGTWLTHARTEGAIALPEPDLVLPLKDVYRGLSFTVQEGDRTAGCAESLPARRSAWIA